MNEYSDFIIFVDESGDHSLKTINPRYPLFVLAFCIFKKEHYIRDIVPAVLELKYRYFGHELVILHEREMRMRSGDFAIFMDADARENFFVALNDIMRTADMSIIPIIIDKQTFIADSDSTLYDIATYRGMDLVKQFLSDYGQSVQTTSVVFEGRGKKEDHELMNTFTQKVKEEVNESYGGLDFQCAPKTANIIGLQLADLVARPIGNQYLHPESTDRAYKLISEKIWRQAVLL
ncbi:DUF3800 domain-containing protein [Alloscardovia macacae]|nr:DUF3800 domain-containing protein [Alloscardovia macacae]